MIPTLFVLGLIAYVIICYVDAHRHPTKPRDRRHCDNTCRPMTDDERASDEAHDCKNDGWRHSQACIDRTYAAWKKRHGSVKRIPRDRI